MKQFNFSHVLSSIILGISIIMGCLIIQSNDKERDLDSSELEQVHPYKPLMTMKEAAEYLNLSEIQVRTIISSEENTLKNTGRFTGKMFPVIRIGNDVYISTNGVNEWLNEATTQRTQY